MKLPERNFENYFIFITFITSFFSVFILTGVILGAPEIGAEFKMNNIVQNWIPTILVFVVTIFTILAGQLCGKYGFKKSLIIGQIIILIGLAICCISISTEMFFASRIMQGIGIAIVNVCEMAIIVLAINKENRGRALGIIVTGVYLGTSLSSFKVIASKFSMGLPKRPKSLDNFVAKITPCSFPGTIKEGFTFRTTSRVSS